MSHSCLRFLKYTMCTVNLLCFVCGIGVFGFGVYMMTMNSKVSVTPINIANTLFITGILITCVSFLGFMGALKENRCLLISFFILLFMLMLVELASACVLLVFEKKIDDLLKEYLVNNLKNNLEMKNESIGKSDWDIIQTTFKCCGIHNASDWKNQVPPSCCKAANCDEPTQYWTLGCYNLLKDWFDQNFLITGVAVIVLCVIEVLGMCFSMTIFCHISRSGLGYK